jgi:hypothetical protein
MNDIEPYGELSIRVIRKNEEANVMTILKRILRMPYLVVRAIRGEVAVACCELRARVLRANGRTEELGVISRKKVTQVFVKDIAAAMATATDGSGSHATFNDYIYHQSGTGTNAESNADTALQTPVGSRVAGTRADVSSGTNGGYRTVATITYSGTFAITEHGVFNATTGGTLLDRSVFSAINVNNGDSIEFTYTLTIQPEA